MRKLAAGLAAGVLALIGLAGPAFAEDVTIRTVDSTAFPAVKVVAQQGSTAPVQAAQVQLQESGVPVQGATVTPIGASDTKVGVVLVLDTSAAMSGSDRMKALKDAAVHYVAARQAKEQVAIVAAGAPAHVVTGFTADAAKLTKAINDLGAAGTVARWDALELATGLFGGHRELQPNVMLVSAGADNASSATFDHAAGAVAASGAVVWTVGVGDNGSDPASLQALAGRSGGAYESAPDASAIANAIGTAARRIGSQFVVTYKSSAKGILDLTLSAGGAVSHASLPTGSVASGAALRPTVAPAPRSLPLLGGASGKWVATGLVVLAAALLAAGAVLLLMRDRADLHAALRPYSDEEEEEDASTNVVLAETGFVRRAVETTGRIAQDRGVLEVIEQRLEQADLPLRAAEALFFWAAAVAITAVIGLFLGGFIAAFAAVILVGMAPFALLSFFAGKRKRKFMAQLPDALQLLAGTLRSGYSLLQGVEAVSQEAPQPMGGELRRVLVEARLGRPLEESLQDAADRMGSADFDWAVMAVRIQREVGGNLAELLDTVGETMVQRERLRRDVRGLTAEGRMSAIVLAMLPPGLGMVMYSLNPGYINTLFHDTIGKVMLMGATGLAIAGFIWMKKMIEIEA